MGKRKLIGLIILGIGLVVCLVLLARNILIPLTLKPSAQLRIDSFPKAEITINGIASGETPYFAEKLPAGDYDVVLQTQSATFNGKVKLNDGVLTYVSRDISSNEDETAGQILTLEKLSSDKSTGLAVTSNPDGSTVTVDEVEKGKTPLIVNNLSIGDHTIIVSMLGFADQVIRGKINPGFRLVADVKLKKLPLDRLNPIGTDSGRVKSTAELLATSSAQLSKPYVIIKPTPTGFLRIRTNPSITSTESGKVYPGEQYALLEELDSWVRIKKSTVSGWVADTYVEKVK